MSYSPKYICVIDWETTGLDPLKLEPHELGAVLLDKDTLEVVAEFESRFKINHPENVEQGALNLNGLTVNELINREKTLKDCIIDFHTFLATNYPLKEIRFAAWNAAFDYGILKKSIFEQKLDKHWRDLDFHVIDLWTMFDGFRRMLGHNDELWGVKQAFKELGMDEEANTFSHRALDDVKKEMKILQSVYRSLAETGNGSDED